MSRRTTLATPVTAAFALVLTISASSQETTVYHGFTRLDPVTATATRNAFVVVQGDRIVSVGSGNPPRRDGSHSVDMSGRYALPGFFDTHAHITIGPLKVELKDGAPAFRFEVIPDLHRHNALLALAYGVTTIRNPAGDAEANAHYGAMIASGEWLGPQAVHAGDLMNPGFPHYPRNNQEWDIELQRQRDLGMTYAKLYSGLSEQELARGIETAHAHGLKTIAHLDGVSWTRAMELGIDELTHALPTSADLLVEPNRTAYLESRKAPDAKYFYRWFELVDYDSEPFQTMLRMLVEKKIHVDLTLIANEIVYFYDRIDKELTYPLELAYAGAGFQQNWRQAMTASHVGWTEDDYRRAHTVMPKVLELAKRFYDAGVRLSMGTDGTGGGPSFVRELALHVEAGIPPWEVLRLATSGAAERLGMADRRGALAPGFEADIVFLSDDPLESIDNVRSVDVVVQDGRAYRAANLLELITGPR
ncbi:MAG TPA: amidohydrolase family protein [Gammaproteobacteria bacterium]|nr:amidohydrolase family protein [Gammaproteobacteria bacterium]